MGLLEQISSDVGHVNHSFAKYSSLVIESTKFGKRWPPARKQELERVNSELVAEFERLSAAEARLLMLGEKNHGKNSAPLCLANSPFSQASLRRKTGY
nr:hypothetical protein [Teredinibacter purpureus]